MLDWNKIIADISVEDVELKPSSPEDSETLMRLRSHPPQNHFDLAKFIEELPGYGDGPNLDGKIIRLCRVLSNF